jgi:hypothetical protein
VIGPCNERIGRSRDAIERFIGRHGRSRRVIARFLDGNDRSRRVKGRCVVRIVRSRVPIEHGHIAVPHFTE